MDQFSGSRSEVARKCRSVLETRSTESVLNTLCYGVEQVSRRAQNWTVAAHVIIVSRRLRKSVHADTI